MIKVLAGIITKDNRILIARRKQGSRLAGKWEFPGGKLEPDETPEECLYREIIEELGIKIKVGEFFCSSKYCYEHISIELLVYSAEYLSGEMTLTDHDAVNWVTKSELNSYDFAEADIPVVNRLFRGID
jgi:8-oxo-dGTP diphosphatase